MNNPGSSLGGLPNSPKEGIKLSFSREELDAVLNNPEHTAEQILNLLERDFKIEMGSQVVYWEGYTLKQHTLMVMKQFRKYFSRKSLPVDTNFFEFILALHDIGKPKGGKTHQHAHTIEIVRPLLTQLKFRPEQIAFATSLLDGSPIGNFINARVDLDISEAAEKVIQMAKKSGLSLEQFWELLKIYYQVDAGSYTQDAGSHDGELDFLFTFDRDNERMSFSPTASKYVDELWVKIQEMSR